MAEGNKEQRVAVKCPFCGAPAHIMLKQFRAHTCANDACDSTAVPFIGEPYPEFEKGVRSAAQYHFLDENGFPDINGVDMNRVVGKITEHDGFRVAWALYYETEEYQADMRGQARFNRSMRTPADVLRKRMALLAGMVKNADRLPPGLLRKQRRLVDRGIEDATAWFEEMYARGWDPR